MEKSIIVFTIFIYLFFTISTVTIASDETSLPTEHEPKTTPTTTESVPESETTQVFDLKTIDPPRMIINRHFYENTRIPLRFPKRHPCKNKFKKMFMIHDDVQNNYNKNNKRVVSYGNDMVVLTDLTTTPFNVEKFPTQRFEFKRKYGHGHHHHHENEEEFAESKYERKEKKKERKGGFMRGFRKFLKHTFD